MQAIAKSCPNIALIKYWGKRDTLKNLPAVDSLSLTLDSLWTTMDVKFSPEMLQDELVINDEQQDKEFSRVQDCLNLVAGESRNFAKIKSSCNFPISAGLASSSSSFSALVVAANSALGKKWNTHLFANQASAISGSAARSLLGGIVELENISNGIKIQQLSKPNRWPLKVIIAITDTRKKPISSSEAMKLSAKTSPFYASWVQDQVFDMKEAKTAVVDQDFEKLAVISEHNCLKMHSVMWTSRPSIVYWNSATINCMHAIRNLQKKGEPVFFTIDAGPQIKAICLPENEDLVEKRLGEIVGVKSIMKSDLGSGPSVDINI